MIEYPYIWHLRRFLPERKGQPYRVAARGRGPGPRNIRVEFPDGFWVTTIRTAVRRPRLFLEPWTQTAARIHEALADDGERGLWIQLEQAS